MSDPEDYVIEFAIGGTKIYVGTIYMESELESWREFAEGGSDEATYVGGSFAPIYTAIEVKNDTAEIHLETDWCSMTTELPAALVRAEIARCLEEPID